MSAHSAGAYTATLLVMVNVLRGGGLAPPHPHQPGLILPSSLNVRQKAAVANLCTLWGEQQDFFMVSLTLSCPLDAEYDLSNFNVFYQKIL